MIGHKFLGKRLTDEIERIKNEGTDCAGLQSIEKNVNLRTRFRVHCLYALVSEVRFEFLQFGH